MKPTELYRINLRTRNGERYTIIRYSHVSGLHGIHSLFDKYYLGKG